MKILIEVGTLWSFFRPRELVLLSFLDWLLMSEIESAFVGNLNRTSMFDIFRPDEVETFVKKGVFTNLHDILQVYGHTATHLPHHCNNRYLVKRVDKIFRCRKIGNVFASTDNRTHQFIPLPNEYSVQCLKMLGRSGLVDEIEINSDENLTLFKSSLPFFHPRRHVPKINPTNDVNISPVEGYTFSVMKSMQNIQRLTGTGGCLEYVCEYIGKIDEQKYVVVEADGEGKLTTKAFHLHHMKVTSFKMGEDKDRKKDDGKT